MSNDTRPSMTTATRAVDAGLDDQSRILACRAVLREAGKIVMQLGGGVLVEGVAETRMMDNLQAAFFDYLKERKIGTPKAYLGLTTNLHDSLDTSIAALIAEVVASERDPHKQGDQQQSSAGDPPASG